MTTTPRCLSIANAEGRAFCHELDIGWVHIVQWIFSILAISAGLFWRNVGSVPTNIQSWNILDPLRSPHGVADRCKGGAEGDSSRHLYKTVTRSLFFLASVTVKSGLVTKMHKSISHVD